MIKAVKDTANMGSGIMTINRSLKSLVDKDVDNYIMSAKKQGVDIDKMNESQIKYILELNKPKAPKVLSNEEAYAFLNKFLKQNKDKGKVIQFPKDKIKDVTKSQSRPPETEIIKGIQTTRGLGDVFPKQLEKTVTVRTVIEDIKKLEPIEAMKEANRVLKGEGKYKNLSKADREQIVSDESVTDHIFERNIKYDADGEEIIDWDAVDDIEPEDFAGGGLAGMLGEPTFQDEEHRVPYKEGLSVEDLPSGLKAEVGDPTPGWGLSDLVNKYFLYQKVIPGVGEETRKYLEEKFLNDLNAQGYSPKDFKAYIDEQFPESRANGGRIGFSEGKGPKMSRRTFLKGLGALAALPVVGKFFKFAKPAAKVADLTSVPIKSGVDGMPAWFKPLVNRVIQEGDNVTKKWATQERQIVHKTKLPDSQTDVLVTQDLNTGNVLVDIGLEKHGFASGKYGQPVRLEYKASEKIEPVINSWTGKVDTKGKKTPEEFNVEEAEFTGGHPENVKFEETTIEKFGKHESDFSEVEAFATGKTKKGARNVSESFDKMNEDIADRFANYPDPNDFASGGIAGGRVGLLWGGGIWKTIIKNLAKERGVDPSTYLKITNYKTLPREVRNLMSEADFNKMKEGRIEMFENWVEMAKTRQRFLKNIEEGKKGSPHAAPIFEHLKKSFKSPVPPGVTDKDILQGEFVLKNLKTKGRKLNASGGLAHMVGE